MAHARDQSLTLTVASPLLKTSAATGLDFNLPFGILFENFTV